MGECPWREFYQRSLNAQEVRRVRTLVEGRVETIIQNQYECFLSVVQDMDNRDQRQAAQRELTAWKAACQRELVGDNPITSVIENPESWEVQAAFEEEVGRLELFING